jgi:DUF4097 and DUF4098 domain-containing protein YvlB
LWGSIVTPAIAATETFHETYEVEPATTLNLHNKNGGVTIRGWEKSYIEVSAEKTSRWGGNVDNVEITVITDDDTLTIETIYLVKNPRVSVTYEISVPEDVSVRSVGSSNGAITLENTRGDVVAETSNGSIEIEDLQGTAKAKTSNGKIEITRVSGYVEAKTSNGSITITDVSGTVAAQTSNGRIRAEIQEIQDDIRIKTSNGSIELYVSPDLNATIEMKTSNGKITIQGIEIIASELSKTKLKGKFGNGGKHLDVKTSNGSIDVYKLQE